MKLITTCIGVFWASALSGLAISSGERLTGSISELGDVDTFSFNGEVGDEVLVGLGEVSGSVFTLSLIHI